MIEESNFTQFSKIILENSISKTYHNAILEWVYLCSIIENNSCICGHHIKENCIIKNIHNEKTLIVGNVCIKKFLEKDYKFVFDGIKKVNLDKLAKAEFLDYIFDKKIVTEYEYKFLSNLFLLKKTKKKLSEKQLYLKEQIYRKLKNNKKW